MRARDGTASRARPLPRSPTLVVLLRLCPHEHASGRRAEPPSSHPGLRMLFLIALPVLVVATWLAARLVRLLGWPTSGTALRRWGLAMLAGTVVLAGRRELTRVASTALWDAS